MTRKEIIIKLMDLGLTHNAAKSSVDAFLSAIAAGLEKGNKVKLSGFGTFYVKNKKARKGMNPKTGERIQVQAKKYPVFKASPELREQINKA
jgi:nucleoid DNA-binding protein